MAALSDKKYTTAQMGIQQYGKKIQVIMRNLIKDDTLDEETCENLFKPVLEGHLYKVISYAEEIGEPEIGRKVVQWQYQLGKTELKQDIIVLQAFTGLTKILEDESLTSAQVQYEAWISLITLLVDVSKYSNPKTIWIALERVKSQVYFQVANDEEWFREGSKVRLFQKLRISHEHLLNRCNENMTLQSGQQDQIGDMDLQNQEAAKILGRWRRVFMDITGRFLSECSEKDEFTLPEANLSSEWKSICINAIRSPFRDHALKLSQALIEIAYIRSSEEVEEMRSWVDTIARVKNKDNSEIVDKAFERMLSYKKEEKKNRIITASEFAQSKREDRYYSNLVKLNANSLQRYMPLNTHDNFPDLILELQQQVNV